MKKVQPIDIKLHPEAKITICPPVIAAGLRASEKRGCRVALRKLKKKAA